MLGCLLSRTLFVLHKNWAKDRPEILSPLSALPQHGMTRSRQTMDCFARKSETSFSRPIHHCMRSVVVARPNSSGPTTRRPRPRPLAHRSVRCCCFLPSAAAASGQPAFPSITNVFLSTWLESSYYRFWRHMGLKICSGSKKLVCQGQRPLGLSAS